MSSQHATTVEGTTTATRARRANELAAAWASDVVALALGTGSSTQPSSGSGSPKVDAIHWTHGGKSYVTEVTTYQEANESPSAWDARHHAAIDALEEAIEDAKGTITG